MKKYKMIEVVGDGTYGTVWKGVIIDTGEKVAIKKLKNKIKTWQECVEMKEVKALGKLKSHQNVIKLKEIVRETNSEVFLIFEYADTNLYEFIDNVKKKGDYLSEIKIKEIVYQIACGLSYTHSNGFFHRDLKPENILIMIDKNNDNLCVKIADFGLARELPTYYNNSPLTDYVCTRWYRPPECILKSTSYSSPMDIWALGCIMMELYMLSPVFPGNSEFDQLTRVTNIIGAPKFNDWPEGYKLIQKIGMKFQNTTGVHLSTLIPSAGMQAINFLYEVLNWDPLRRPNIQKLLSHPYFDEVKSFDNYTNRYTSSSISSGEHILNNNTNNTNLNVNTNNYYEDYLNNFNYKNYRNHNSYVPEINSNGNNNLYNYQISNTLNNNSINNSNNKSKFSYLAENDMKFNKFGNSNNSNNINNTNNTNTNINKINNNNFYFNSNSNTNSNKNDYYGLNSNNNFYYDLGSNNKQQNNYSHFGFSNANNNNTKVYKPDIENNIINGSYPRQSYFNFPQIFI